MRYVWERSFPHCESCIVRHKIRGVERKPLPIHVFPKLGGNKKSDATMVLVLGVAHQVFDVSDLVS